MTSEPPAQPPPLPTSTGGKGCLFGLLIAVVLPVAVFSIVLTANRFNPQCGTPADSGGCEMGLAAGTIAAVVIGIVAGIVVAVSMNIAERSKNRWRQ